MMAAMGSVNDNINIFNLGVDDTCVVDESIGWICEALNVQPELSYSGGYRGWIGDNPVIHLDTQKIRALGWEPKVSIREGVIKTVRYLQANEWVFAGRAP
jgi:UDP-glucose 4-epimerase